MPWGAWNPIPEPIPAPVHQGHSRLLELQLAVGTAGIHSIKQLEGEQRISARGIPAAPPGELARSILCIPCFGGTSPSIQGEKAPFPQHGAGLGCCCLGFPHPTRTVAVVGQRGAAAGSSWTRVLGRRGRPFCTCRCSPEKQSTAGGGRAGVWLASL